MSKLKRIILRFFINSLLSEVCPKRVDIKTEPLVFLDFYFVFFVMYLKTYSFVSLLHLMLFQLLR